MRFEACRRRHLKYDYIPSICQYIISANCGYVVNRPIILLITIDKSCSVGFGGRCGHTFNCQFGTSPRQVVGSRRCDLLAGAVFVTPASPHWVKVNRLTRVTGQQGQGAATPPDGMVGVPVGKGEVAGRRRAESTDPTACGGVWITLR